MILGGQYASSDGNTDTGNMHNPGFIGLDSSQPFTLTATFIANWVGDLGGGIEVYLGSNASLAAKAALSFNAGDGALNQISNVNVVDSVGSTGVSNVPATSGVNHQIILQFDGTDLILYLDAVEQARIVGATIPARSSLRFVIFTNAISDILGIQDITISQP